METITANQTIARYMGFQFLTVEEQMRWCGVPTIERLSGIAKKYIPSMKRSDGEIFFNDSLNYHDDWNKLMKVVEKINKRDWVTIYSDECKIHPLQNNEFTEIVVTRDGEPLINSVYNAIIEYLKLDFVW